MNKNYGMYSIIIIITLITLPTTSAYGQSIRVERGLIRLDSSLAGEIETQGIPTQNALNYSSVNTMSTVLNENGYGVEGMYWGHSMPRYRIDYHHTDYILNFSFAYNFSFQDVQTGCLGYWLWLPVDGDYVQQVLIYDGFWKTGQLAARANNSIYVRNAIFNNTGIFIYIIHSIRPGYNTWNFLIYPKRGFSIPVFIGNEYYSELDCNYSFLKLKDLYENNYSENDVPYGEIIETAPGSPPVSFLFVNGQDRVGYSSIVLPKGKTLVYSYDITPSQNNTYSSIYLPFRCDIACNFYVSWSIGVIWADNFDSLGWGFTNPVTWANNINIYNITYNNIRDFLLVSCPWVVNDSAYHVKTGFNTSIHVQIIPSEDITVLIGNTSGSYIKDLWDNRSILYNDDFTGFETIGVYPDGDSVLYHVFIVGMQNVGPWARTYNYSSYYVVDTGFVKGYRFPGETFLRVFWDSGREHYINMSCSDFWEAALADPMTFDEAWDKAVRGAWRFIGDDYCKHLYDLGEKLVGGIVEPVVDTFWEFLKIIWKILEETFDYIMSMVKLIPWILCIVIFEAGAYSFNNKDSFTEQFKDIGRKAKKSYKSGQKPMKKYYGLKTQYYKRKERSARIKIIQHGGRAK